MRFLRPIMSAIALMIVILAQGAPKKEVPDTLSMRHVFSSLKETSLDLLPLSTRLDMLDYYDVDSLYKARNAMDGVSVLDTVTADYLKVKISDVSNLQIKLLASKKYGKIVMTIYTVGTNDRMADSEVNFYDSSLSPLQRERILQQPELKEFFSIPKGSITNMKEISEMVPFPTMEYTASAGNDILKVRLTVGEYVSVDDFNILKLFLKPDVEYIWTGDKFKLKKQ